MGEQQARTLIKRYLAGRCTDTERVLVERYFNEALRANGAWPTPERIDEADKRMMQALLKHLAANRSNPGIRLRRWVPYAAAALLVAMAATGVFFLGDTVQKASDLPIGQAGNGAVAEDILPGGNRATLTLADGRTIDLHAEQRGIVVTDGITYMDGSSVLKTHELTNAQVQALTLTTPKGGTYRLTLPDGSNVWLNSASTLRYPSRFSDEERVVFLEGEAYFEISHGVSHAGGQRAAGRLPFRVVTNGQRVEVLGTAFNISAYPDENVTKTTLVEGSVAILNLKSKTVDQLRPGHQAILRDVAIEIHEVDTEPFTAWKEGYFYFKKTPLDEVLRQVSRWYDVDVRYKNGIPPNETLSGDIKRNVSLRGLLEILQLSTINVELEGKSLIVN